MKIIIYRIIEMILFKSPLASDSSDDELSHRREPCRDEYNK